MLAKVHSRRPGHGLQIVIFRHAERCHMASETDSPMKKKTEGSGHDPRVEHSRGIALRVT